MEMEQIMLSVELPEEARGHIHSYIAANRGDAISTDRLISILRKVPEAAELYKENKLSLSILDETLKDIAIWAVNEHKQTGQWGLSDSSASWLKQHVAGKVFKLGRLQFAVKPYNRPVLAYRHIESGRVIAFPSEEIRYRADGQVSGTNGIESGPNGFTGYSTNTNGIICGTPLSPHGCAVNRVIRLNAAEWRPALSLNMPGLELHVPQGGAFTIDAVRASLIAIDAFVRDNWASLYRLAGYDSWAQHSSICEAPYAAFFVCSWLLDALLACILPESSNIVRYLREFYLTPYLSNDEAIINRVFEVPGASFDPYAPPPLTTTLQQRVAEFMKTGNRMRANAGFILAEDILGFGSVKYRNEFVISQAASGR